MINPTEFHRIASGKRRGVAASMLRAGLRIAEFPYTWAVQIRNHRFDRGHAESLDVGIPVVSVGNLTLGGTGKTPLVAWLADWFTSRGVRVAVVSRGYGGRGDQPNDETLEMTRRLPHVPLVQNPDRVAGARWAIQRHGAQVILLDDGFQHRRLNRDLDIVLLDALQPDGFGHVFPRGCLREPFAEVRRADVAVLTRSGSVSPEVRLRLRESVVGHNPSILWLEATHAPIERITCDAASLPLDSLRGESVVAFCGIGNPQGFRDTLGQCGCRVVEMIEFPDHHAYDAASLAKIESAARRYHVARVLCTMKDFVKIQPAGHANFPLEAIRIDLQFTASHDLDQFQQRLNLG